MQGPGIIIPDSKKLEEKLSLFRRENMRVVADFDGTITHPKPTSWGLLDQIEHRIPGYTRAADELYRKYHRFKIDPSLSKDEKTRIMAEWWQEALGLFRKFGIREEYFREIGVDMVGIREGMIETFDYFREHAIPVLILSAGVHQTIDIVLKNAGFQGDHISLSANELIFDETGRYVSVLPEGYIHAGNKNEHTASHKIGAGFSQRSHIILLGDSLHDIDMISPHERAHTIAVGYCHEGRRGDREHYSEVFDIVVSSDYSDQGTLRYLLSRIG